MLQARGALWNEFMRLHREMLKIARADNVCRRLMSAPGIGALVAINYRSAVDDPDWFGKSRLCGATPVAVPPYPKDTRTNIVFRNPTLVDEFVLEFQKPTYVGIRGHRGSLRRLERPNYAP
jgi:hypothetical protein